MNVPELGGPDTNHTPEWYQNGHDICHDELGTKGQGYKLIHVSPHI